MKSKIKIGIIGGGNMGAAIISGLVKKYAVSVCEQDKRLCQVLKRRFKVGMGDLKSVISKSQIIILAVKPQDFEGMLKDVFYNMTPNKMIISIAAGITSGYIEKRLGGKARVVRVMPNLPVQIGQGITAVCGGKFAKKTDLVLAAEIFDCIGKSVIVEEKHMDAVTAVSGSGPAYVFYFVECLQKAARSLNLKEDLSKTLIMQTLQGSLNLLEERKEDAAVLRGQVTSKGGTTQAAMDVLMKGKLDKVIKEALAAARKRSKQLAK